MGLTNTNKAMKIRGPVEHKFRRNISSTAKSTTDVLRTNITSTPKG